MKYLMIIVALILVNSAQANTDSDCPLDFQPYKICLDARLNVLYGSMTADLSNIEPDAREEAIEQSLHYIKEIMRQNLYFIIAPCFPEIVGLSEVMKENEAVSKSCAMKAGLLNANSFQEADNSFRKRLNETSTESENTQPSN